MRNRAVDSYVSRRLFLGLGALAGMLAVSGCGEPGVTQADSAPAAKGGNRARLDRFKAAAEHAPVQKTTKKK
jgi:hypothetical protein